MKIRVGDLVGVMHVNSKVELIFNEECTMYVGEALKIPYPLTLFKCVRLEADGKDSFVVYVEVDR